jgi:hypothetical protein
LGNSKKPCPLFCDLTKFNGLGVDWPEKTFVNPPYDLQGKTAFATILFLSYRPKYEGINSRGEWVNPYNAIIDNETRLQLCMLDCGIQHLVIGITVRNPGPVL